MKKIYASQDVTLLGFYKSLLEQNGIPAIIKNYFLTSAAGEIPINSTVTELWILDDDKVEQAMALISTQPSSGSWTCSCGEKISGQFGQCWKCGKVREDGI